MPLCLLSILMLHLLNNHFPHLLSNLLPKNTTPSPLTSTIMNPESMKSLNVQHQIRRNAEEQASFLKTMGSWEEDIKKRDQEMRDRKAVREKKEK